MKFSIITPSYNQAKFIGRTIESIITQQGDFEIELIVMDGGSSDGTVEILKDYESRIKNKEFKGNNGITLSWESKRDKGQSDAINQGLKKATGEIVAYLNSDDVYLPEAFAKVVEAINTKPDTKWLTGYCRIIDQSDKPIQSIIKKYKNFWLRHHSYQKLLILNYIAQPSTFWHREAMDKIGLFNERLHYTMDYEYWLRLGKNYRLKVVREELAGFRIHSTSKGKVSYIKQFKEDYETAANWSENIVTRVLHRFHNEAIKIVYNVIK